MNNICTFYFRHVHQVTLLTLNNLKREAFLLSTEDGDDESMKTWEDEMRASTQYFQSLERFTVILYDKTSPLTSINEARMSLFCKNNKAMDKLPPSQVILYLVIIIKF